MYSIFAFFPSPDGKAPRTESYIGTKEELYRNIVTTWSKVPHTCSEANGQIDVLDSKGDHLATFILELNPTMPLPGHF
jgi:hypothetical protein